MSHSEAEYAARLLVGTEPLVHPDGSPEALAEMYLSAIATNADFKQEVREIVGKDFDSMLSNRMRAIVPSLLNLLKKRELVYAIFNHVYFITNCCPAHGIPIEEFTSISELRMLWQEAHLRSARKAARHLDERNWHGVVASAVLAGISPDQIGVSEAEADTCIDSYFGRTNPKLKSNWEQHQADYATLRKLLSV